MCPLIWIRCDGYQRTSISMDGEAAVFLSPRIEFASLFCISGVVSHDVSPSQHDFSDRLHLQHAVVVGEDVDGLLSARLSEF